MSIRVQKPGLLDTLQDRGRYGYQQSGINPGGAMDRLAMRVANMLVGNDPGTAVLEMHFPAAVLLFETTTLIALSGADFSPEMEGREVPLHQPVLVNRGTVLQCKKQRKGARTYLAVAGGFESAEWLHSASTQLQVKAGGFAGRALQKQDSLLLKKPQPYPFPEPSQGFVTLPWRADMNGLYQDGPVRCIAGNELDNLDNPSRQLLTDAVFQITRGSDRMGYRLQGPELHTNLAGELVSTAVTRGTIQLLPNGQLIVLMADHQTTGGYPRLGHVTSADLPVLAQKQAGEEFGLQLVSVSEAEKILREQEMNLQQLQNACNFRLDQYSGSRSFIKT